MTSDLRLHSHPISPYARKVEIMARIHALDIDVLTAVADGPRGYTDGINPLGKIPALETAEDGLIFDSPVICEYLDVLSDTPLLPTTPDARLREQVLHALGDGLSDATYHYRYETVRDDALHWPKMIERHTTALTMTLAHLEDRVDTLGTSWRYGNIAVICGLDYMGFRAPHISLPDVAPKLAAWLAGFVADTIYQQTYHYD